MTRDAIRCILLIFTLIRVFLTYSVGSDNGRSLGGGAFSDMFRDWTIVRKGLGHVESLAMGFGWACLAERLDICWGE